MMQPTERPPEGHALRTMRQEGLEAALEVCRNARKQAYPDQRLVRLYQRQAERIRYEMQARLVERSLADDDAQDRGAFPEVVVDV